MKMRIACNLIIQVAIGLGCFTLFWLGVHLAERNETWLGIDTICIILTCIFLAVTIPYLGSRFVALMDPRLTAITFSVWFVAAAVASSFSLFGQGGQWTVFAFWFPAATASYFLTLAGSKFALKQHS